MKTIDFSNCANIAQSRELADTKLSELDSLKRDKPMRMFILTRITEKEGKFTWNFNVSAISNFIENIMDFPSFSTKFTKPTLFLGGEKSNYIMNTDLIDIYKIFNDFKVQIVKNAGHVVHLDNPKDTIEFIDNFLNDKNV
jgi:esterase